MAEEQKIPKVWLTSCIFPLIIEILGPFFVSPNLCSNTNQSNSRREHKWNWYGTCEQKKIFEFENENCFFLLWAVAKVPAKILTQLKMGLISDRKNKAKKEKESSLGGGFKNGFSGGLMMPTKKGIFGPQVLPAPGGHRMMPPKYPPGYYTTPVHHSSWSHPSQPKGNPNVNPRYQTWVAPRKQPALGQLVKRNCYVFLKILCI